MAAADSTMSGGKNGSDGNPPLNQPSDAVAMSDMPDGSSEPAQTADPATSGVERPSAGVVPSSDEKAIKTEDDTAATDPESRPRGKDRSDSIMAIGPAVEDISLVESRDPNAAPVCNITLLLTTGSRHPYKIDAKYLARRNVTIPDETEDGHPDPFSISIYTLKELILREWRSDWDSKPSSPTSIRLIHFGKLLDDKEQLKKYQLSPENPNVVHMSVRPQDLDEEEPKTGSKHLSGSGNDGQRSRGSGCCVIL